MDVLDNIWDIATFFWKYSDTPRCMAAAAARNICYQFVPNMEIPVLNIPLPIKDFRGISFCEKTSMAVFDNTYTWSLLGGSCYLAYNKVTNTWKERQYGIYTNKSKEELKTLSKRQLQAFLNGAESATDSLHYYKHLLIFNNYRNMNAYYAGYAARQHNDNTLIQHVRKRHLKYKQ